MLFRQLRLLVTHVPAVCVHRLVSYVVAEGAKSGPGVKLRWWQSTCNGRMIQDWAIDSLITDGTLRPATKERPPESNANHPAVVKAIKSSTAAELDQKDQAAGRSPSADMQTVHGDRLWWRKVNVSPVKSLCKQEGHILQGSSSMEEESLLETVDMILQDLKAESQLKFELLVGHCDEKELQASSSRFPVRFEISLDHGVTWRLFQPLVMRGQAAGAPHAPSLYFPTKRWQTVVFPLERLTGVRYVQLLDAIPAVKPTNIQMQVGSIPLDPAPSSAHQMGGQTLAHRRRLFKCGRADIRTGKDCRNEKNL